MFPLGENREPLGLSSEEKFMETVQHPQRLRKHKISDDSGEKRTRFVDTESIGLFLYMLLPSNYILLASKKSSYRQVEQFLCRILEIAK